MTTPTAVGGRGRWAAAARTRSQAALRAAARWPWWVQTLLLYIAARALSAAIFVAAARQQGPNPWFAPHPDYWNFISIWDGRWYQEAADNGYPSNLPLGPDGEVQENAWAFYPIFPMLGRVLSAVTGMGTLPALTLIAMVAGAAAALVAYQLFREFAGVRTAVWGVLFVSTFPVSPVLQVPYAESLNLLLLAGSLLLVVRRHCLTALPVVVLMCLSRPTGVPFAAMVGLLFVAKAWQHFRSPRDQRDSVTSLWPLAVLVVVSAAAALAWPGIAWAVTGEVDAYTRTETVWRGHDLVPFKPWFDTGVMLFGPVLGVAAPVVFAAAFAGLLMSPPVRKLGPELRLWCACYMGYLLVFLHPQTSTFRMLLPLFPLALATAFVSRSKAYRGAVLVMFILLQVVWVVWLWAWAQLPGGGDYPP
ncbi:hypothetical protein [Arthrobacter sp. M4]|uniref:hypothetical protein n=1 Tax=Arthrobacter sp. M4 TaxID=218160 RepID=UPI001CDB8C44|nr:hypothetical protein [Arthrobacter sp. M4]MCA4132368.1 hypothetical protein [Arthrobacter sp. M4]